MRKFEVFKTASERRTAVEFYRKLAATRQVVAKSGHQSNSNTAGGYLLDEELFATIERLAEAHGVFLAHARTYDMNKELLRVPRRSGAATFHFTAETETAAESTVDYGMVTHHPKKAMGFIVVSNELLNDAANCAEDITLAFAQGYAEFVDDIAFNGDGTEEHGGFMGLATLLEDGAHAGGIEAAAGHDTLLEVDITDLSNLVAKLPTRSAANAAWYCSHFAAAKTIFRLAAGGGGIGRNAQGEATFWNWPIRNSPTLPAVDSTLAGDAMLMFGDMRQSSSIGSRRQLLVEASALGLTFAFDQTKFRAKARLSILHTDIGDSTTVGAMVALIGKS